MPPRALLLEERGAGSIVLVGRWPELARIDPLLLQEIAPVARQHNLRQGDDFVIELANARATYRYVEDIEHGDMLCVKIR